jgi:hypothetical protein
MIAGTFAVVNNSSKDSSEIQTWLDAVKVHCDLLIINKEFYNYYLDLENGSMTKAQLAYPKAQPTCPCGLHNDRIRWDGLEDSLRNKIDEYWKEFYSDKYVDGAMNL